MKHIFPILLMTAAIVSANVLPADGEKQMMWAVNADLPEAYGSDDVWDMSQASYIDMFERVYHVYGDTLFSRQTKGVRDWFSVKGDSVLAIGSNSRAIYTRLITGLPYMSFKGNIGIKRTDSLKMFINDFHFSNYNVQGESELFESCSFIFPDGSSTEATLCVKLSLADSAARTEIYSWFADSCKWPVVEYVRNVSLKEECLRSMILICPPDEQGLRSSLRRETVGMIKQHDLAGLDIPKLSEMKYWIEQSTDEIRLKVSNEGTYKQCNAVIDDYVESRLYDVAGRLWYEQQGLLSIQKSFLPQGDYIIDVESSGVHTPIKIWVYR